MNEIKKLTDFCVANSTILKLLIPNKKINNNEVLLTVFIV